MSGRYIRVTLNEDALLWYYGNLEMRCKEQSQRYQRKYQIYSIIKQYKKINVIKSKKRPAVEQIIKLTCHTNIKSAKEVKIFLCYALQKEHFTFYLFSLIKLQFCFHF